VAAFVGTMVGMLSAGPLVGLAGGPLVVLLATLATWCQLRGRKLTALSATQLHRTIAHAAMKASFRPIFLPSA